MSRLTRGRLSLYRVSAGFASARTAAVSLKCSTLYLHELERGAAKPSAKMLAKLAKTYRKSEKSVRQASNQARIELLERELAQLRK